MNTRPVAAAPRRPDTRSRHVGSWLVSRECLASALALAIVILQGSLVLAAEPASTPVAIVVGDPRSEGTGPGLVGSPLLVLGAVFVLGVATVLLTALLVWLGRRR